jgi:hypothetical protein
MGGISDIIAANPWSLETDPKSMVGWFYPLAARPALIPAGRMASMRLGTTRNALCSVPIIFSVSLLAGCSSVAKKHFEQTRFATQDEAGSGHVAVLSVIPWDEETKAYLQPQFTLTPEAALSGVVPTGMVLEQKLLDALKVVASVAAPTTSVSQTASTKAASTATTETGKEPVSKDVVESTNARTETKAPGQVSTADDSAATTRAASDLPNKKDILDRDIGIDPQLKHALATAYYQEVQLLNHYVNNAATREGYTPYVVRIQVTLMPTARNEPYDAYTTVSFFQSGGTPNAIPEAPLVPATTTLGVRGHAYLYASLNHEYPLSLNSDALVPGNVQKKDGGSQKPADAAAADKAAKEKAAAEKKKRLQQTPIVVPLLVTDSLEAAFASRSTNVVRQYAVALTALISGFGLSAGAKKYSDELLATVGNDYNSLFTVSRLTDNTIRVRMGAMLQSAAKYAMVPQTRNVSLLVLVPDKGPNEVELPLALVARTVFVDAISGKALESRTEPALKDLIKTTFERAIVLQCVKNEEDRLALLRFVAMSDFSGFVERMSVPCQCDVTKSCAFEQAWTTLTSVWVGSQYSSSSFSLPKRPVIEAPPVPDTPVGALDDGKATLVVSLPGGKNLSEATLSATLCLDRTKVASRAIVVPASKIAVGAAGQSVQVTFPSLSLLRSSGGESLPTAGANMLLMDKGMVKAIYPLEVLSISQEPKPKETMLTLLSVGALKATDSTATLEVVAKLKAKAIAGTTLMVTVEFTKDTKPASGSVIKEKSTASTGTITGIVNDLEIPVPKGLDMIKMLLALEQLADGSTAKITAALKDAPKDTTAAAREILVAVPVTPPKGGV